MNAPDAVLRGALQQRWLAARFAALRQRVDTGAGALDDDEAPPSVEHVARCFGLSPFERELLLLAAGIELDGALRAAVAQLQHGLATHIDFALALDVLPGAHWDAISPAAPLRRWQLLHADTGAGIAHTRLRIDERVLHFLTGVDADDPLLRGLVRSAGDGTLHADPAQWPRHAQADIARHLDREAALRGARVVLPRTGLDALAEHVEAGTTFADLVLPGPVLATLREIASHVEHEGRVFDDWGFGRTQARGRGIAALFSGESGTGKTLAAEAIANELQRPLHRIDLALVVSKYIGETEKNLERVFDAAEDTCAVLLFDEADALFGKRSDVKDSHDRYANIEIAYLLQRVEAYRGLAILTTNLRQALDRAFLRRLRFVVHFPFPDEAARRVLWQRQFAPAAPLGAVDFDALARIQLPGGHIRAVALNAAFAAARRGTAIEQPLLLDAARAEFGKLERTFAGALA